MNFLQGRLGTVRGIQIDVIPDAKRPSGPYRRYQTADAQYGYHSLQVIGQNMQAHLSLHPRK